MMKKALKSISVLTALILFVFPAAAFSLAESSAAPVSLSADPSSLFIFEGASKTVAVTAQMSDGTKANYSSKCTWSSSDSSVASVTKGKIKALRLGTATITAVYDSFSVVIEVYVTAKEMPNSLEAGMPSLTLMQGKTQTVKINGVLNNGKKKALGNKCQWISEDSTIATVSVGKIKAISAGTTKITAKYGTLSAEIEVTVAPAPSPVSISVSPSSLTLAEGASKSVTVNAVLSDGSKKNLSSLCSWSVGGTSVATVSGNKITGLNPGSCVLTASYGELYAEVNVTVTAVPKPVSLTASSTSLSLVKGKSQSIKVTGTFEDGSSKSMGAKCAWTSSDASVVKVTNGTIRAVSEGSAVVKASFGSLELEIEVTVTASKSSPSSEPAADNSKYFLLSSMPSMSLSPGSSTSLLIIGILKTGGTEIVTDKCTWSSSSSSVASVTNGVLKAVSPGSAAITATCDSKSVIINVFVAPTSMNLLSLEASPGAVTVKSGDTKSVTVNGIYSGSSKYTLTNACQWSSSDASIASVNNGVITGVKAGTATISASFDSKSVDIKVTVVATQKLTGISAISSVSCPLNKSVTIIVNGVMNDGSLSDLSSKCTWSSSDTSIATVSKGKITGVGYGTATIYISYSSFSIQLDVTV